MEHEGSLPFSQRSFCLHPEHINPGYALPSYLLKIHFNIILACILRSSKWANSLRFPHWNPVCNSPLPYTCHMTCPSHSPCLVSWRISNVDYKRRSFSHAIFSRLQLLPLGIKFFSFLSTLFSNTFGQYSSLNEDKFAYPSRTLKEKKTVNWNETI
jgi:hypothetical protein